MSTPQNGKIYAKISAVMTSVGAIGKGRQNMQQGYKFRGIDEVYNAIHGPLAEHGVFIVPVVLERELREQPSKSGGVLFYTTLKVQHRFYCEDGSFVEAVTCGEAMDSGDKSTNKAMSAAMKYAIIEVFAIPTEDLEDADASSPQPVQRKAAATTTQPPPQTASKAPVGANSAPKAETPPPAKKGPPQAPGTKGDALDLTITEFPDGLLVKEKTGKPKVNTAGQEMPGKPYQQWGYPSKAAGCTLTTIKAEIGNELDLAFEEGRSLKITYEPNQYGGNIKRVERVENPA